MVNAFSRKFALYFFVNTNYHKLIVNYSYKLMINLRKFAFDILDCVYNNKLRVDFVL